VSWIFCYKHIIEEEKEKPICVVVVSTCRRRVTCSYGWMRRIMCWRRKTMDVMPRLLINCWQNTRYCWYF